MSDYPIKWRQYSHGYGDGGRPIRERDSLLLIFPGGTVEAWRTPTVSPDLPFGPDPYHYGGIEVHSKTPLYTGHRANPTPCQWTKGTCYHDGTSTGFDEVALDFDSDHEYVYRVLSDYAPTHWTY